MNYVAKPLFLYWPHLSDASTGPHIVCSYIVIFFCLIECKHCRHIKDGVIELKSNFPRYLNTLVVQNKAMKLY
jgi:hypothetical protein